jgi:hypothetical protein
MQPTSARDRNIGDAHDRLRPEGKSVATTILIALVICMFLSKPHGNQSPKSMELDARAARIVDPAFCKDQTWPYIDQRCLKRIDASDGTANNESAGSPATNPPVTSTLTGEPPEVPENNADAAIAAPLDRQMEDASQHHPRPHRRRHAQFIFGFRF